MKALVMKKRLHYGQARVEELSTMGLGVPCGGNGNLWKTCSGKRPTLDMENCTSFSRAFVACNFESTDAWALTKLAS
jgi:hypothetical protein